MCELCWKASDRNGYVVKYRILFVCLGNICRSPTAHGLFRERVRSSSLSELVEIDSAGTGDWHIGRPPDPRAQDAALEHGFDISDLRARTVTSEDFERFDMILAMDQSNLSNLQSLAPSSFSGHLGLFLDFIDESIREVPDPYYGGPEGFDAVIDLVGKTCDNLIEHLIQQVRG